MKRKQKIFNIVIYVVLIGGILVTVLPFVWMILTSFKTQNEATVIPPAIFPKIWQISNYGKVFEMLPFGKMYFNTIISAGVTVSGQVLLCSLAAYAFARIHFPGKNILFFHPASVPVDTKNGTAGYDTGIIYTKSVQRLWYFSAQAVFHGFARGAGGRGTTGWLQSFSDL